MASATNSRSVQITLHSSIQHPGQKKEQHHLRLTGQLIQKAQTNFLKYEEQLDDLRVRTTVKMTEDEALIMRSGGVSMRLPFSLEQIRAGQYGNGPAQFNLNVKTASITTKHDEAKGAGSFSVHYELLDNEQSMGTYELTLTYTEGNR